ncbi:hypothetical protein F1D05_03465 [Kribbella qitaiheensis]|uniref:DUF4345 domain-containing protein n=1 Tax=Kribbella qitaiheensis TaxID=1544730 RepID=A0A7G6WT22_9ACTN|nr:hypothetical protein [Kribbella qitaiheensis]QNE17137.1 hypothetical protein F1D05_03465 [Kribbella qitaiheensis]
MKTIIRTALLALAALQLTLGVWTSFFPRSFYEDVPTVDWTPPYSEHLFRDFGGVTLGTAVMLLAAAYWLDRRLVILALAAYLTFSVPHAIFHSEHLMEDSPGPSATLLILVILSVLLPLLVIWISWRALATDTPGPR